MFSVINKKSLRRSAGNYAGAFDIKSLPFLFVIPLSLIYLEFLIKGLTGNDFTAGNIFLIVFGSLCIGTLLNILCTLTYSPLFNGWICFLLIELSVLFYALLYFVQNSYGIYMNMTTITEGAGDVARGFGDVVLNVFIKGSGMIVVFHIPAILYLLAFLLFRIIRFEKFNPAGKAYLAAAALIFLVFCILFCVSGAERRSKLSSLFSFDTATRQYSLQTACVVDILAADKINSSGFIIDEGEVNSGSTYEIDGNEYNIMDINFDSYNKGSGTSVFNDISEYVQSLTPSAKNEYTGMFEGKNLIMICAESFEGAIIDEELTPALYRLLSNGIQVSDYYQPQWSGNTSSGELQFLTGEWPISGGTSIRNTIDKNMYFTMGNQLQRLGYNSWAFHDGDYDYYNRYMTHPNLGYSEFIAIGTGMEDALTRTGKYAWPQSDLEMMEFAVDYFIDNSPFSVYFMTLSGHSTYSWKNAVAAKNRDAVADLPYSEAVKAYIAANLELEYALDYLLDALDEAGIINDTVIVLTSDHYPYGLNYSYAWNTTEEYLSELFGYYPETTAELHKNELIIWCGELEDSVETITVETPVSSIDILPTLSNLFGVEYDSRMLIGRDILDDNTEPLVLFSDYSWLTDLGYFDSETWTFTANDDAVIPDNYVNDILQTINNKMTYCKEIQKYDYFGYLFGTDLDT